MLRVGDRISQVTKHIARIVLVVLIASACASAEVDTSGVPYLETVTVEEFASKLESLGRPAIVNVWASWCIPCRSEAPLLTAAHLEYGGEIEFIGVNVRDSQTHAKEFIAEFGVEFDSYFDSGRAIPNHYAGIGTPITFFFAPGGELLSTHNGVIDDHALALGIDELLRFES